MNKPNNYESIQTGGDFTPVNLGGHTAIIKRVQETTSKNGKPMITVGIDFDQKDSQPNYFMDAFKADTRDEKKWPFSGMKYILTEDQDGNCSRSFKAFISSVEQSNNSKCDWGDGFERWFVNKKVGVVYGEEEHEYNGKVSKRHLIRYFCNYEKAPSAAIPEAKLLDSYSANANRNTGFVESKVEDDDIPF